ncbi:MAG: cation transporter [Magnetococcales bacterium]|nr:cation transporter [Magnetococcales bacterium]
MTPFKQCQKCVVQAGWTDLAAAIAQAIFRSLLGWLSGSLGLVVQGLYSIGDAVTKSVTLFSIHVAKRPPSKTFPFGFGKVLFISSFAIGVVLIVGGIFLGLTSFTDIVGIQSVPSLMTAVGILLSAAASECMYRFLGCVAKENNNSAIESASMDNRLDAASSIIVLIGIFLSNIGIPSADHMAAFVISLLVIRIGGLIAWDAIKGLLDVTVSQDALSEMARTARMIQGVQEVKLIRGRSLGEYWEIYLHIAIDEKLTIRAGHDLSTLLKERLLTDFPKVQHIWVVTIPSETEEEDGGNYWKEHLFSLPPGGGAPKTPADNP